MQKLSLNTMFGLLTLEVSILIFTIKKTFHLLSPHSSHRLSNNTKSKTVIPKIWLVCQEHKLELIFSLKQISL